jgi:acetyl coenzyme A synthetase (ADP forming)-like protein
VAAYVDPGWCVCDAVLADGGTVHIRPITPEDGADLVSFHAGLSQETVYFRFFGAHPKLSDGEVERFTNVDHDKRMALVATLRGRIIGVARYDRTEEGAQDAEVAFVVADEHQGRGIATLLLEHLAAFARTRGITRFRADTLPQNQPMQEVFRRAGFAEKAHFDQGVVNVWLDIEPNESTLEAIESRWRNAAARSVERLLCPRSVAVIGASRTRGTIGHELLRNVLSSGFTGPVYPVHPSARSVASVRAYPSVLAIPDEVDLAVVVVSSSQVPDVIDDCVAKGVKGVVVISAGFAEVGSDGEIAQREMVAKARGAGMRVIGPNCMGVINTAAGVSLNATFAPVPPEPGRVAFSSQSGGLGIAVLEEARRRGVGLSSFVSVGNKADVSGNDLLQYWQQDDGTDVILLYLESFGNPRRFARVARQVSRTKPIVAVKAGRTIAGSRAASSHTAALASPDTAVDALFAQTGVIRVDTLEELFDAAQMLSTQPVPAGRRIAIVGNAGGPGILAADACEAAGLEVPELSSKTQDRLRSFLHGAASVRNPVDMVASAGPANYEQAIRAVLDDDGVDAVISIFIPPLVTDPDDVARAISAAAERAAKPVVANFLGMTEAPAPLTGVTRRVPCYTFPEPAVRALAHACEYGEWLSRPAGTSPIFPDLQVSAARGVVQSALNRDSAGGWLGPDDVGALLAAYGIHQAESRSATSPEEAGAAADDIGYPVALKAASAQLVHKTDADGVALSLTTADEVREAFVAMESRLADRMGGATVQAMAPVGVETIVGLVHDPSFGPLVMFGTGGTAVELFGDRSFRILPLTGLDAAELVRSVRGSPLLFGYRGSPEVDVSALEDLLLRVGLLAEDIPEIAEMDLNPVIAWPGGAVAVDAKIRVTRGGSDTDPTVRTLS